MVAVVTVEVITAVTVAVILNLVALTLINPLGQKVGKIEVMGILLKTPNMKMVEVGEKGEFPMRAMLQTRQIKNSFLQARPLI